MASAVVNWPEYLRFRDAFAAALDPRFYPISWLDGEVACGRMLLLTGEHSAILFSVKTYPSGLKELHGELAVGNLGGIVHDLIPRAELFGKEIGCSVAVIQSREGWNRVMRDQGYELYQTAVRKAL